MGGEGGGSGGEGGGGGGGVGAWGGGGGWGGGEGGGGERGGGGGGGGVAEMKARILGEKAGPEYPDISDDGTPDGTSGNTDPNFHGWKELPEQ